MNPAKKQAMLKSLRYWGASYAVVAGFMYYKTSATLGSVLIAGFLTFLLTLGLAYIRRDPSHL